jgi:hypothetical protein
VTSWRPLTKRRHGRRAHTAQAQPLQYGGWGENLPKGSDAKTIDAGQHGDKVLFPTGTEIKLHLHVIAGDSKDAFDTFLYDSKSNLMARYVSCGGPQSSELGFEYITDKDN